MRTININNFHVNTSVIFKGCKKPTRNPDFISNSGSYYWYGENKKGAYVIRYSDHWVRIKYTFSNTIYNGGCNSIGSCNWNIRTTEEWKNYRAGKAYISTFKENN